MTYKKCKGYIRSDYYRVTAVKSNSILKMFITTLYDVGFRFLFWFRLSKCSNPILAFVAIAMYRHLGLKHKIYIPRSTQIGYGFRIMHGGPCVINASANIGDNVVIGHFSTIGSTNKKAATIGDDVYIGPSVCIVENVKIGNGVTIGAGAVVVKDIEEGATVAGNPAKIISYKTPGRLVWRKWNLEWNNYS